MSTLMNWDDLLLLNPLQIVLNLLMSVEVFTEALSGEIGLQVEYFLRDFVIFSFDALQLCLTRIKVQTSRFELNIGNRFARCQSILISWQIIGLFLSS